MLIHPSLLYAWSKTDSCQAIRPPHWDTFSLPLTLVLVMLLSQGNNDGKTGTHNVPDYYADYRSVELRTGNM